MYDKSTLEIRLGAPDLFRKNRAMQIPRTRQFEGVKKTATQSSRHAECKLGKAKLNFSARFGN